MFVVTEPGDSLPALGSVAGPQLKPTKCAEQPGSRRHNHSRGPIAMNAKDIIGLHAPASISLKGFISRQDETHYWINDGSAVWMVSKGDVVGEASWAPTVARADGEPKVLRIRDGAEIHEMRRYKVDLRLTPLTVAPEDDSPRPKGADDVLRKELAWARRIGITTSPMRNPTTTSDQGGGEPPLHGPDDCGW